MVKDVAQVAFNVTLELNEKWARNMTREELIEYIEARLTSSLGFRGQLKKFKVVSK